MSGNNLSTFLLLLVERVELFDQFDIMSLLKQAIQGKKMTKQKMAEFLATVSFRNGTNTFRGRDTLEKWIEFYMTLSMAELKEDMRQYGG